MAFVVTAVITGLSTPLVRATITLDMVTVGDAGNLPDPRISSPQLGAVGYEYLISKHEVTIGQYAEFLNAVAGSDPYGLWHPSMGTYAPVAGIARSGVSGSYTYSVIGPLGTTPPGASNPENRPITYVDWYDAARFANWMTNGQGSGSTETGAYALRTGAIAAASRANGLTTYTLSSDMQIAIGDQVSVSGLSGTNFNVSGVVTDVVGNQFTLVNSSPAEVASGTGSLTAAPATRSPGASFFLPSTDEWYKAAYYSPALNGNSGGYYLYPTQSNDAPGNQIGNLPNQANYRAPVNGTNVFSVTPNWSSSQNYLTEVGAFAGSSSYYGTFDQAGNVREWTEGIATRMFTQGDARQQLGGFWNDFYSSSSWPNANNLSSLSRPGEYPTEATLLTGFRLASPVPVPEPSITAVVSSMVLGCGVLIHRRRRRSNRRS